MTTTENLQKYGRASAAHMGAAKVYAKLSRAKRLKVGAVIVRDERIISVGYNGTPSGRDNNCEFPIEKLNLLDQVESIEWFTKQEVCHAEMNAIMFAAKNGTATDGCDLYITHSPCFECAKMIIQSGIKRVFYETDYRDTDSIDFLLDTNVEVIKL